MGLTQSFFQQHLIQARGASMHTIRAYRDALRLFLEALAKQQRCSVDRLTLSDVSSHRVIEFLVSLEKDRRNTASTRNCRHAALRSWVKHLMRQDLERADQYAQILALPAKRATQSQPVYLEPEQFRALLEQVDMKSTRGVRDAALLLFLYNTGARVSEALRIRWIDVELPRPRQVRLQCKGGKERICPLWKQTVDLLCHLKAYNAAPPEAQVFMNARGVPITRDGVAYILRRYYQLARRKDPSLPKTAMHPHVLRHSCAVALLQAGIDLTAIRDYLGHSSISTTGRYLQTNLATKRQVLGEFWKRAGLERGQPQRWRPSKGLLAYLESL